VGLVRLVGSRETSDSGCDSGYDSGRPGCIVDYTASVTPVLRRTGHIAPPPWSALRSRTKVGPHIRSGRGHFTHRGSRLVIGRQETESRPRQL